MQRDKGGLDALFRALHLAKWPLLAGAALVCHVFIAVPLVYVVPLCLAMGGMAPRISALGSLGILLVVMVFAYLPPTMQLNPIGLLTVYLFLLGGIVWVLLRWRRLAVSVPAPGEGTWLPRAWWATYQFGLHLTGIAFLVLANFRPWNFGLCLALGILCCFAAFALARALTEQGNVGWNLAANTAVLGCSLLVALVLLELAARIVLPTTPVEQEVYMPHPETIFTLNPGGEWVHRIPLTRREKLEVDISISEQGLRDRPFGPKGPGVYRIALLGDSFTMGHAVEFEDTISQMLEECLQGSLDREVQVINAGMGGAGPWQQRAFLKERVLPLEPDLLLYQFYPGNDIENALEYLGIHSRAYHKEWQQSLDERRRYHWFRFQVELWLRKHSRAYATLYVSTGFHPHAAQIIRAFRWGNPKTMDAKPPPENRLFTLEACLSEWYPELERGYAAFEELVGDIRDLCAARDIPIVAFSIPASDVAFDRIWRALTPGDGTYEQHKDTRMVAEALARLGIPHLSVTPALTQGHEPGEVYYLLDGHLTPRGNALVARRVSEYLLAYFFPAEMGDALLRGEPDCGPLPDPPSVVLEWTPAQGAVEPETKASP